MNPRLLPSAQSAGRALLAAALLCGCRPPPAPPAPAPPPPPAPVVQAPPPPPPPRCEALEENCVAVAGTRVALAQSSASFSPPLGWKYAASAERATAVHPEAIGLLTLSSATGSDNAALLAAVQREVDALAIQDFAPAQLQRRWKKPDGVLAAADGELELWEVDARRQRGKAPRLAERGAGTLLIAVSRPSAGEPIVALAFVLESAGESDAPKLVMQALESLKGATE